MGYTAVRGGLDAIEQAEALVDSMPLASDEPLKLSQLQKHLQIAIARVMAEGGLHDVSLAALAIKQAEGDVIEAGVPPASLPLHAAPSRLQPRHGR